MLKSTTVLISILINLSAIAQPKMRPLNELINTKEPGWLLVKQWIDTAKNKVEVLARDTTKAKEALFQTQVTTRSPMGAVIFETGGILIDNGWIRILGSGNSKLNRSLPGWNKGKSFKEFGEQPSFLLIADDAAGGFFAINGGAWGKDLGQVYYMSPDNLKWQTIDLTYSDFLLLCFSGNLNKFYDGIRWKDWKKGMDTINGSKAYNFFPPLYTKEGRDVNKVSKNAIPVEELYDFDMEMRKQIKLDKDSY